MRLTPKLQQFITGPHGIALGTRDSGHVPDFARVLGAKALDEHHIMCFIDAITCTTAIENIKDNGNTALVVATVLTYESYQFKGRCVQHRTANDDEGAIVNLYMKGMSELTSKSFGMAEDAAYNFPHSALYTLVLAIDEIFEQTPRPGTGNKLI